MANLNSVAELAWRQLFPNPGDENAISKEEFLATSRTEYCYQLWLKAKADKREEGMFDVPSYLLTEVTKEVINNEIDLSDLKIMRSWDSCDQWLQNVGGVDCKCRYVKSTLNLWQILCDDDSLGDAKIYYVVGKKIKFPLGTHKKELPLTYANIGQSISGDVEVDDTIAAIVRRSLIDIYSGKIGVEDETNDSVSKQ